MVTRISSLLCVSLLALFLAGCAGNDDKYVVKTPVPPAPQQGQGTGH
jgi:PBP1b-binding outer membrane lipoprotein LpoB